MRKSIISKTATALGVLVSLLLQINASAAYSINKAVVTGMSAGFDIIDADTSFSEGYSGWEVSAESADIVDEALQITSSGSAGLSTNIGSGFYRTASAGAPQAWDFETDDEFTENKSLSEDEDIGKWAPARNSLPISTVAIEDVEPYNYKYAEEGGTNSNVISWQPGVTELIPAVGSKRCLMIMNPSNKAWTGYMGIRTRLSSDVLCVGKTYTLSFWMMENSNRRAIYCGRTPYDAEELSVNTDKVLNNGVINYEDSTHNLVEASTVKQWTKYSITFTPQADEFNSDGYTTLWLITTAKTITNQSDIYKYEKIYFDNICIEEEADYIKTTNYRFSAAVKGEIGTKITAKAEIDGENQIFELSKTISKEDEWENMTLDFSVDSDIPYLFGGEKGSVFETDNSRVKLSISSDGNFSIDNVHIINNISGNEFSVYTGGMMYFLADVVGLEDIDNATAVYKIGSKTIVSDEVSVKEGMQTYEFKAEIPSGGSGAVTFNITSGSSIFDKENIVSKFFRNGANIYPSMEALKIFGEGQYLVEFNVDGGTEDDMAQISIGGITETADVFADGVGIAEICLTKEDIEGLTETDSITVLCGKTVSNITLKKVGDLKNN